MSGIRGIPKGQDPSFYSNVQVAVGFVSQVPRKLKVRALGNSGVRVLKFLIC